MAPPSPPSASRLSNPRVSSHDLKADRQLEQAGRSSSNLHAQVSAASLREADRTRSHTPSSNASKPNLLRKKSRPQSPLPQDTNGLAITTSTTPSEQNQSLDPRVLASSSRLNPSRSYGSSGGSSENSRKSSDGVPVARQNSSDAGAHAAAVAISNGLPPPPRRIPASRGGMGSRDSSSSSLAKQQSPRSIRDLGSDYTRFYNPFDTRNNSATDLSSPLPQYTSATNLLLPQDPSKRMSDPFADGKQGSNPFDSDAESHTKPEAKAAAAAVVPLHMQNGANEEVDSMDPEKAFFPYLDDRLGAPDASRQGYTFPMYWDEKEPDDDMHMPMFDDDVRLKPKLKDHFNRQNIVSTFGLIFMILGLFTIFIVLPVLSSTGLNILDYTYDTPLDQMGGGNQTTWATVNNRTYALMTGIRTGLIDPDTPEDAMTRTALDGSELKLVFSDEFNAQNRTFYPGDDPYFFGLDGWYGATQDLEWYDPDAISTWDGTLQLQLDAFPNHGLQFRSGMLNSWNQMCFKGGVFEVSVSLPGPGGVHGLWPGVWSMGNLGRPGYLATTDGMWPYTYNECDVGITPNQSMNDGTSKLPGQRLTSCGCEGSDHPTPGTGRGAPEIDIIEVSGDWGGKGLAVATQSFQVAPFDVWWYPNYEFMETPNYQISMVNTYTGGPYQQAVSTTTMLNNSWYDGELYQKYAYEYTPGSDEDSGIAWYVGEDISMRFDARALAPNGNIGQRLISEEPMSIVMNLGISENWVDINWAALKFPTIMRIDYVRIYQPEGEEMITCDPPGYETTEYIKNHPEAYNNYNYTHWTDIPGYTWPQNTLMHNCDASS